MRHDTASSDLNVADFLKEIWQAKVFLFLGVIVGLMCAFVFVKSAVPHARAHMMIGPAQGMEISARSDRDMPAAGYDAARSEQTHSQQNFVQFQARYSGAGVAKLLLRDPRIVEGLKADQAFVFSKPRDGWNPAILSDYIAKRVWFDPFGETVLREMNYLHPDPGFAAYFLQQIHRTTDQLIRAEQRAAVDQRIAYLERESAKAMNPDHRRAMTTLILEQERVRMSVLMDEPVAAKVVERSAVSAKPAWPDTALVYTLFSAMGLFVGYLVYGLSGVRRRSFVKAARGHRTAGEEEQGKAMNYARWFKTDAQNSNIDYETRRRNTMGQASDAAE